MKMNEEECLKQLIERKKFFDQEGVGYDTEDIHIDADEILRQFLLELGYHAVVKAYDSIPKWYS